MEREIYLNTYGHIYNQKLAVISEFRHVQLCYDFGSFCKYLTSRNRLKFTNQFGNHSLFIV